MKLSACPLCKSDRFTTRSASREIVLARCSGCGMVWDPDPPENPAKIYEEAYYNSEFPKGGYSNYFESMRINCVTFRKRLIRAERRLGRKGKLLDVGCALGDCLIEARGLGWPDPQGLEVSPYAVEFARTRGFSITQGELEDGLYEPESFDLLLLQDVIEHTTKPLSLLQAAQRHLKPGGLLLITTPNVEGFWQKVLGGAWYHYKPGEHLTYFSTSTIRLALRLTGFARIEAKPTFNSMSLYSIFDRLRFYDPTLFSYLMGCSRWLGLDKVIFSIPIGELEAWAIKPVRPSP